MLLSISALITRTHRPTPRCTSPIEAHRWHRPLQVQLCHVGLAGLDKWKQWNAFWHLDVWNFPRSEICFQKGMFYQSTTHPPSLKRKSCTIKPAAWNFPLHISFPSCRDNNGLPVAKTIGTSQQKKSNFILQKKIILEKASTAINQRKQLLAIKSLPLVFMWTN